LKKDKVPTFSQNLWRIPSLCEGRCGAESCRTAWICEGRVSRGGEYQEGGGYEGGGAARTPLDPHAGSGRAACLRGKAGAPIPTTFRGKGGWHGKAERG
jgi:hypothetical protein